MADDYGAALTSSAQVLSSAMNYAATGDTNRRTLRYNREMYERQRKDALADWDMQNQYNSPAAQMQRLREAGLNPNLVYGKGADNVAQQVRSTDAKSWSPEVPKFDLSGPLMSYYDVQMREAQTDNLRAQNEAIKNEALLKALQGSKVAAETARSKFDLGLAEDMRGMSLEAMKQNIRKMTVGSDYLTDKNEREAALTSTSISEALTRIGKIRADTDYTRMKENQGRQLFPGELERQRLSNENLNQAVWMLQREGVIKDLDVKLALQGIQPGRPAYDAFLKQVIDKLSVMDFTKDVGSKIKQFEDWLERVLPWGNDYK